MNVSLVTACKDRNDCLKAVIPSWLKYKEIKEIIIVDWSCKESLESLTGLDKRIKVIKALNEKFYIPSQANNLGVSIATCEHILRVDTDYFLNPYYNFFNEYKIDESSFVCGDPEISSDRDNNPYYKYLFGLLYITKNNFNKVNGYNEKIGYYYSHEDKDIFERLKLLGLKQIKLKNNYNIIHIPHPDKKRYENFEGGQNSAADDHTTVETHIGYNLNKFIVPNSFYALPVTNWNIKQLNEQLFEAKKGLNKLKNLPQVNCISLEESVARRKILQTQFKQYNINHINFLKSKRFALCNDIVKGVHAHTLNPGTAGCCISHLKNIKQWLENTNEEYGFFCEDDLSLETVKYWNFSWEEFLQKVPSDWECVQLLTLNENISSLNIKNREWNDWGATAYILKRSYAQKLIEAHFTNNNKTYFLELPKPHSNLQPLIENLLFVPGKTYTVPLFAENIDFESTFSLNSDHNFELHAKTHKSSYNKLIDMWKNNKKHKVIDFFTFYEPLGKEMFELRINMLKDYVDGFIVCESNKTQSGHNTPFKLKQIISDLGFEDINIRVIELQIPEDESLTITKEDEINCYENNSCNRNSLKARARERLQKDALLHVFNEYDDEIVFLHSDIDEIIDPKHIQWIANIVRCNQNVLIKIPLVHLEGRADLRVFNKHTNLPKEWTGMFMCTKHHLLKATPTQLRSNANNPFPINFVTENNQILQDLGWHFSWMGNANTRNIKCQSFTHYDDSFSFLITSKYKNPDTQKFHQSLFLNEDKIPPSGDKNFILKKYPIKNLPQEIFSLPRVKNFLLQSETSEWLYQYGTNVNEPILNFNAGIFYYEQGHTAPALSYFLRCAERTNNKLLAYEALIYGYLCYKEQKIRDETAKSLIMHAVCLLPERPEARWLLSIFFEQKQRWMYSYYHAERGLDYYKEDFEPLITYKEFPGKYSLLFQKAISGYWWGKNEECKNIFLDLYNNYDLNDKYRQSVKDNLKRVGIEIS